MDDWDDDDGWDPVKDSMGPRWADDNRNDVNNHAGAITLTDTGNPMQRFARAHDDDSPIDPWQNVAATPTYTPWVTVGKMIDDNPHLHRPVVDGLLREGEVANIISTSKVGKSWLAYGLVLSVLTGRPWLDRFETTKGRVLLIDNELHLATLAHRIRVVAEAMGIPPSEYREMVDVWALRGQLRDIHAIGDDVSRIFAGTYRLIIVDALYRMVPADASENDNAAMARLYSALDGYAGMTGAAWVCIHHATKGSQTDKRVTDVGAGAGAQSRAADAHIVLREHEDKAVMVLEAAVRSYPPVDPLPLRWSYPVWLPDGQADPTRLRGRQTAADERQTRHDREGTDTIRRCLARGPQTLRQLRDAGLSRERLTRLLGGMETAGEVRWSETKYRGTPTREYSLRG